jgi:hypothetical protein
MNDMAKKHSKNIGRMILKLLMVIPAVLNITVTLLAMVQSEWGSMRKKMVIFIILALFCLALMTSTWLCVTVLLLVYLQSLQLSLIPSLVILLLFNFMMLVIVGLAMNFIRVDPSFSQTRKTIKDMISN